jgi:hypothetical protein
MVDSRVHRSREEVQGETVLDGRPLEGVLALIIVLTSLIAYGASLGYSFTGVDTLTLTDTGRLRSYSDVIRIFTEPLMNGTEFVSISKFYRPVSTLSYGLDHAVWGLEPFGYQLTNLLLHCAVSVLVFGIVYVLTGRERWTAWLAGFVFTTHPILAQTVPVTSRRQDILASLFLLLALLSFFKLRAAGSRRWRWWIPALGCYALSLGSKEIGIVLPVLAFVHAYGERPGGVAISSRKLRAAIGASFPFFVLTGVYLVWRAAVLGGIGGRQGHPRVAQPPDVRTVVWKYVQGLSSLESLTPRAASLLFVISSFAVSSGSTTVPSSPRSGRERCPFF